MACNKFVYFEGLRGALALLVCISHLGLNTILISLGVQVRFSLAVDAFFVMSGFVLSHAYFFAGRSFSEFLVGRFARLYPLHIATLLLTCVAVQNWPTEKDQAVLFQNLFLLQSVGLPPHNSGPNFPSWSISVEFWVALLYFLLVRKTGKATVIAMTLVALPLVIFLPNYAASQDGNHFAVVNGGLLRGIVGFAVGISSFVVFQKFILIRCPGWLSMILTITLSSLLFVAESSPLSSILFVYIVLFFLMIKVDPEFKTAV